MLNVNSFPSNATSSYQTCSSSGRLSQSNYAVEGLYFCELTRHVVGEEVLMDVFEWNDPWVDVSGGWAGITFDNLSQVGQGYIIQRQILITEWLYVLL